MNRTRTDLVVVVAILLVGFTADAASADDAFWPWAGWGGYVYGSSYVSDSIPYYAMYPPVYYSYRVARTYGSCPFAYLPSTTPGSRSFAPRAVESGYASSGGNGENGERQGPTPLRIDNPFVEQTGDSGTALQLKSPHHGHRWSIPPLWLARAGRFPPIPRNRSRHDFGKR